MAMNMAKNSAGRQAGKVIFSSRFAGWQGEAGGSKTSQQVRGHQFAAKQSCGGFGIRSALADT